MTESGQTGPYISISPYATYPTANHQLAVSPVQHSPTNILRPGKTLVKYAWPVFSEQ
ncbi:hypothetical protein KDU71_03245 [Carboxylicivirga sediminis]|uniref:Uncharacterized protein n=1 Tax=Carboxylicivirga sediminis TaxID=2006564 RepID=A0A941F060_9BACT|nr:hypothetical protein [Carboxylicivirga sediminis]MBR8534561.1 hypothetical protein [Carboxylicivirga sediminis]